MTTKTMAKKANYYIVNGNGSLIKTFGADYRAAVRFVNANRGCGLMYGLRIKKQFLLAS